MNITGIFTFVIHNKSVKFCATIDIKHTSVESRHTVTVLDSAHKESPV